MSSALHPRPQLSRNEWIGLDGEWAFATDDENRGVDNGWYRGDGPFQRRIRVPFPPESGLSGIGEDAHPIVWYRLERNIPRPIDGRRLLLHFEAVDYEADVWVNGVHVARHEGGQVGFQADVTHALADSAMQTIVVRAFDDVTSLEQPRGKQDWEAEPHVIWYSRTTGIWRQVWAEVVSESHIRSLDWTPRAVPGEVAFEARLAGESSATLRLQFSVDGEPIADITHAVRGRTVRGVVELDDLRLDAEPDRLLWSPEHPTLIDVHATLEVSGETVDSVQSYMGLRAVDTDERNFLLNGRPYFLRLVLEQGFWPQSHLSAPSEEALRAEVQAIKDLGFNGIRMHQVVADQRFLYWCDRIGLLVWADAAAAYRFSGDSLTRLVAEWTEIIERDRSHPSIVAWIAFNESWGVPDLAQSRAQRDAVTGLYHLIKALDPSRPVVGNDGWEFVVGDMLGIHDYTQSADALHRRYGSRASVEDTVLNERPGARLLSVAEDQHGGARLPVVLSEFGGVSYTFEDNSWAGYGAVHTQDELLERLTSLLDVVNNTAGLAGFCYTQLTDTLQEANGLLTADRAPKADVQHIAALVRGDQRSQRALVSETSLARGVEVPAARIDGELTTQGEMY